MDDYRVLGRIGEGAHGVVLRARRISSGDVVALKRLPLRRLEEDGVPVNVLRELCALQRLRSGYVVRLLDAFPQGSALVLSFEHMHGDLSELIRDTSRPLSEAHGKRYLLQLLQGTAFLHTSGVIHRDLKPANLLISHQGRLKLADLGLSRLLEERGRRPCSHQVATRWYRAPELLFGARHYGVGVDLWAVGCILAELLSRSPVFRGETDIDQLLVVLRALGTPTEQSWPGLSRLPDYNKIPLPEFRAQGLAALLPEASEQALALLGRLLIYRADRRLAASEALRDVYLFSAPLPTPEHEMPPPRSTSSTANPPDLQPTPVEDIIELFHRKMATLRTIDV